MHINERCPVDSAIWVGLGCVVVLYPPCRGLAKGLPAWHDDDKCSMGFKPVIMTNAAWAVSDDDKRMAP